MSVSAYSLIRSLAVAFIDVLVRNDRRWEQVWYLSPHYYSYLCVHESFFEKQNQCWGFVIFQMQYCHHVVVYDTVCLWLAEMMHSMALQLLEYTVKTFCERIPLEVPGKTDDSFCCGAFCAIFNLDP